jgi:hypothetical protein
LSIGQQHDTLSYARNRSGAYRPQLHIMLISSVRRLRHWMSKQIQLSFGWRRCCRVVCCCWNARMVKNVASIPKIVPHVIYPSKVRFILNWPSCHRVFYDLCVEWKKNGYYILVWSLSMWLAHGMLEATLDFSTIWTMELSSLSRIFDTWCFH